MEWNVLPVSNAQLFNSDISKWDVSSVENMDGMFLGTASLADVVCVIVPLVSANVSLPSLVKGVVEPLSPSTAVETDNTALTPTLSTTLIKLPKYHTAHILYMIHCP